MGWRYSRRVTLFPSIRLNIGASSVSTTFGMPSAGFGIDRDGLCFSTVTPMAGFYAKINLDDGIPGARLSENSLARIFVPKDCYSAIRLGAAEFTSPGFRIFHEMVSGVLQERMVLSRHLVSAQQEYVKAKQGFDKINWIPFIEKIVPSVVRGVKVDLVDAEESIEEIEKQIRECRVKIDFSFESRASEEKWNNVIRAVDDLQYSSCIWGIFGERRVDRVATRSSAYREVERVRVSVYRRSLDILLSRLTFPIFVNSVGSKLVLMPGFVITLSKDERLAFFEWSDISVSFAPVLFTETERVPTDGQVVEMTWRYVNKSGSQDMRFSDNYEIPVMRYADIIFESKAGMREVFMFSNFDRARAFQTSLDTYLRDFGGDLESIDGNSRSNLEVLGLEHGTTKESVRDAYMKLLRQYHPDKFASLGPEFIKLAEEKTKEINRAYGELCE